MDKEYELLSNNTVTHNGKEYSCRTFSLGDVIYKKGTNPICFNENRFLKKLSNCKNFPNVINFEQGIEESSITINFVKGQPLEDEIKGSHYLSHAQICQILGGCLDILMQLARYQIIHRDIRPDNIIISKNKEQYIPVLIDFGWGKYVQEQDVITPSYLGDMQRFPGTLFNDSYSMGYCLIPLKRTEALTELVNKFMMVDPITDKNFNHVTLVLNDLKQDLKHYESKKIQEQFYLWFEFLKKRISESRIGAAYRKSITKEVIHD
ncbi:protein kinase domain-containing protein [Nonlabens ponticola]|uniref:protein kinase domain-containing protein n=1 Tax=Nonlabens ponticola TaxID=2496866 RepID=UPI0013DE9F1C|nr:hypothetical protein [Nonlabens ponticola]